MSSARSCVAALLGTLLIAATAAGDNIDDLSRKLRGDADYKVRLQAALSLGKLKDVRGVAALVDALADRDRTVRSVAAGALGAVVDGTVAPDLRQRVTSALALTARNDADAMVRDQAQRAYDRLRALAPPPPPVAPPPPRPAAGGVYVEVGPMADATRKASQVPQLMRKQVMNSLGQRAPQFLTGWPSGRSPSELELKKSGAVGFYIDGTLTALSVSKAPPRVTCQVSLLLATYPQKSMFAFLKGGAEVESGSTSEGALAEATSDCVGAVLDDLVGSKLVPTIRSRVP